MRIQAIQLHPIKALDAVRVEAARVLPSGVLDLDRRWALIDGRGRFVNGKNRAEIHQIRAQYNLPGLEVTLNGTTFSLEREGDTIARWFSEQLAEPVSWREDRMVGFPDDLDSPGPTCVSSASIMTAADWFGLSLEETRRRFRTNLEFDAPEPFWEDRLYGAEFRIGEVHLFAVNPCQRCVVPSRDSRTGTQDSGFPKRFAALRQSSIPAWAPRAAFNHYYRFAVNTRIAAGEAGKVIRVGDPIA